VGQFKGQSAQAEIATLQGKQQNLNASITCLQPQRDELNRKINDLTQTRDELSRRNQEQARSLEGLQLGTKQAEDELKGIQASAKELRGKGYAEAIISKLSASDAADARVQTIEKYKREVWASRKSLISRRRRPKNLGGNWSRFLKPRKHLKSN
jgi:chromosome segregation ATPase